MEVNSVRAGYPQAGSAGQRSAPAKQAGEKSFSQRMRDAAGQEENPLRDTEEMMGFIRGRKQEIMEKVRRGETEVKIRIGAQEYTQKEWNKLMESFDETEDDIRRKLREAREQQREVAEDAGI